MQYKITCQIIHEYSIETNSMAEAIDIAVNTFGLEYNTEPTRMSCVVVSE